MNIKKNFQIFEKNVTIFKFVKKKIKTFSISKKIRC